MSLLFLIAQQMWKRSGKPVDGEVKLFVPTNALWKNLRSLIDVVDSKLYSIMDVAAEAYTDGLVFDNGDIRVTALHNEHWESRRTETGNPIPLPSRLRERKLSIPVILRNFPSWTP